VYDPNDDLVRPTSPMSQARAFHVMLTLGDGNVLVAGGSIEPVAELFDPKSGAFRDTAGAMTTPRIGLAGALLDNGLALLIGGADETGEPLATAELYDPASGTFVATGSMSIARQGLTATVLDDGRVLVAGGSSDGSFNEALASAEIYDPTSGTFSLVTSQMSDPRTLHTATLLADGRVLVAGGANSPPDDPMDIVPLSSLDIFDPATGAFSPAAAPLAVGRFSHTATAVAGGLVLIAGGTTPQQSTASAETFDPTTDAPSPSGDMNDARNSHTATAVELPGGHRFVLMAGGIASVPPNEIGTLASTERWAVP
jgi:hypothetical protein